MKYIYDLHRIMIQEDLILVYEGEFTQEITKSVLSMTERNMESMGEESSIKRKVFNVMVECLQNICKHAEEAIEDAPNSAIFIVGKRDEEYVITSGNPIRNDKIALLSAKLDQINGLDKEGLKNLYKEIIRNTELSEKGGAGLGFVDMARKSGQKLEYNFHPVTEKTSFFSLQTRVSRMAGMEV